MKPSLLARLALIPVIAASVWVLPLRAESDAKDLASMSLEDLLKVEIVQSASKYGQSTSKAPASTVIVTAREIRAHGWRTLAEVLGSVHGFYFTNDRFYDYVGVRGFGPLGDYNTNVLVTIDGHRLNENIYDSVGYGGDFPLDMEMVDKVEVIMGPGSALYGNNAVFATVNILTRPPAGKASGEYAAEVASRQTARGFARVENQEGGLAWVLAGSLQDSLGETSDYYREWDDPATNNGVAKDCDQEQQRRVFTTFRSGRWSLQGLYNHRTKRLPTAAFSADFNNSGNITSDRCGYLDLSYAGNEDAPTYLSGRAYVDNYIYKADYVTSAAINRDIAEGDCLGGEAQVVTKLLPRQTLIAGLEGKRNTHQFQTNFDVDGDVYVSSDRKSTQWAAFLQDEVSLHARLQAYLGVRYDDPYYVDGTWMPRGVLVADLGRQTTLKAMVGESYRAPNQYEMFYVDNYNYSAPGRLNAEKIRTYELFAKKVLSRVLSAESSVYYYKMRDMLVFSPDPDGMGTMRTVNMSDVRARGVETLAQYRDGRGFAGRVSYNYQEALSSIDDTRLVNAPLHLFKAGVILPLRGESLLAGVDWQGMSKRNTTQGGVVGGYGVVSVNPSSLDWPFRGCGMDLGVRNLLDRRYLDPVSDAQIQDTIAQYGRTVRFKLTLSI